jgi:Diaminopimelate decarboxylase
MHEFTFKDNELYCEDVKVSAIAKKVPTPFYLYSYKTLIDHYSKIKAAFSAISPLICFSVKSNSNIAILRALVKNGAGLDIVSGGELHRARAAGADPKKIVYAGVGKRPDEIEDAINAGILFFNVESEEELEVIQTIAASLEKKSECGDTHKSRRSPQDTLSYSDREGRYEVRARFRDCA